MWKNHCRQFDILLKTVSIESLNYEKLVTTNPSVEVNQIGFINAFLKYFYLNTVDINQDTLLHVACRHYFIDLINYILQSNINVNAKDKYGKTALHNAIIGNPNDHDDDDDDDDDIDSDDDYDEYDWIRPAKRPKLTYDTRKAKIIQLLLKNKSIDINDINNEEKTALELALEYNEVNAIKLLIKHCSSKITNINDQLFHEIVYSQRIEVLTLILPYVENINSKLDETDIEYLNLTSIHIGDSALHTVVRLGDDILINLLLRNNIDVNLTNAKNLTALHLALDRKLSKIKITPLIKYGANCNLSSDFNTTLNYAIEYDNMEIFKLILLKVDENNINNVNEDGESALHTAVFKRNEDAINLLLQNNIDVNLATLEQRLTALHLAFDLELNENIILTLLEHGANCNLTSKTSTTLHYAIEYDNNEIIKLVLSKVDQDNINAVDSENKSALYAAMQMKNVEIINLLLQNNIDVNLADKNNVTALHVALLFKLDKQIILSLLDCGANYNSFSNFNTMLQYVIQYDNIDLVTLFLSKLNKAEICSVNIKYGESALQTAVHVGNKSVINLILNQHIDMNIIGLNDETALQAACVRKCEMPDEWYGSEQDIDIIELLLPYHTCTNKDDYYNILDAFAKVLQNANPQNTIYMNIINLLLIEGRVRIDAEMMKYARPMAKEALQLMLLSFVKHNQLVHNVGVSEFYYSDAAINPTEKPILIRNVNCDYDCLLQNFNELEKMRTLEISTTHKITYFQFLYMDKYQIASMLRSPEYHQVLRNYGKIRSEFPQYSWLILKNYTIGKNLNMENIIFTKCLIKSLPIEKKIEELSDSINFVIKKLTKYDILNFIEACRNRFKTKI